MSLLELVLVVWRGHSTIEVQTVCLYVLNGVFSQHYVCLLVGVGRTTPEDGTQVAVKMLNYYLVSYIGLRISVESVQGSDVIESRTSVRDRKWCIAIWLLIASTNTHNKPSYLMTWCTHC